MSNETYDSVSAKNKNQSKTPMAINLVTNEEINAVLIEITKIRLFFI
jgi:hypothetical protein